MPKEIEIQEFKGVFTNADVEDLPAEYLTVAKNMRSYNGRLMKTFGPEEKISDTVDITNLATYIHRFLGEAPQFYNNLQGKVYIGIKIEEAAAGGAVYLYGLDESTDPPTWVGIHSLADFNSVDHGAYLHKKDKNPIIQVDGILRILPGNVSDIGGNESIGIWIGGIKRTFWDGLIEYGSQIYIYPTTIEKPELLLPSGFNINNPKSLLYKLLGPRVDAISDGDKWYYKFSYIYDGIQEGLLSDDYAYFDGDFSPTPGGAEYSWYHIQFTIARIDISRRITALKVYRSEKQTGPYSHIHTIDFLRPSDKVKGNSSGIRLGYNYAYIPELSSFVFTTGLSGKLHLSLNGVIREIDYPGTGSGFDVFHFTSEGVSTDDWNEDWDLLEKLNGFYGSLQAGSDGAYSGNKTFIIMNEELDADKFDNGVLAIGAVNVQKNGYNIDKYYKKAIHQLTEVTGTLGGTTDYAWHVMSVIDGLYFVEENGTNMDYWLYDPGPNILVDGPYHPLAGSPSIKANGDVAQVIGGRLWQGNPILDPGGNSEEHIGRVVYSELEQRDVNPVGNLLSLSDREGGAITGMAEILGNPVFTKPHAIHTVDIKGVFPPFPIIKSEHNIGNIAKHGLVQVGESLYVCYFDGIYRLTPNNLAESDDTPTERLKISDPIGDMYQGMTLERKEAIEARYDQRKGEIIYKMNDQLWAYNIDTAFWRQHDYDVTFSITALDETANIIIYDETDQKVYTLGGDDWVSTSIKLKQFRLSEDRAEIIRYFIITYQSVTSLTLNLYTEYSDTPAATYTLPKNEKIRTVKIGIRKRAEVFTFELIALSEAESSQLWDLLGGDRVVIQEEPGDTDTVWEKTGDRIHLKDTPVSNHIWTLDGDRVYINPLVKTVINKIKIEHT